jgi:[NiFe] hydrogenase diaphorase moiety large subunit
MKPATDLPDRRTLLNDLWAIQLEKRHISDQDIKALAEQYQLSEVEIEGVVSFYHFFHRQPAGQYTIYINNSVTAMHSGMGAIIAAFEEATGARLGQTDPTGVFGLYETSCIGLSDLEPAALINFQPFINLTPQKVKALVWQLRRGVPVEQLADPVPQHLQHPSPPDRAVLLRPFLPGQTLKPLLQLDPEEALSTLEASGLRGMGGAFFPVGKKWRMCREQPGGEKYILCNADEGEPGTFKDRMLLQYLPGLVIEGMIHAAYATGAAEGWIYLRGEYRWLLPELEAAIKAYYDEGWLGAQIPAKTPFRFDLHIQLGAGAYVCGEETAMMNSLEGLRGEPRVRTYFPVERGYRQKPTVVNNVETFAAAARVIELGADCFATLGTSQMKGTRLLSIAGDCERPGIYEIEWGTRLAEVLDWAGATSTLAVQISGPSGQCIDPNYGDRRFDWDDLRCGGAVTVFNTQRDLLQILRNFSKFFAEESCGVCTPCRAGNFIFTRKLDKLAKGLGRADDYLEIQNWSNIMRQTSRCGLGRAATNALLTAIENFPGYFTRYFSPKSAAGAQPFDLEAAVSDYRQAVNKTLGTIKTN